MTLPRDLGATHAWRGAFVAAALNAVGMPGDFLLARDIPDMPWYPAAMSALVGVGLIALLLIRRQRATVRLGSVVFLVNTVAILVALWITSGYWAAGDTSWTPFQANKLGALAAALLAPGLGVGLASIGGFAATAIGKFYLFDPEIQGRSPVGEPWLILFYALFGGVLLAYRLRSVTLERETLRLQAEAAAAEQLAGTFLRLRDYANTPIQIIAFTAELLRVRHPHLKPDLGRLERAVERLMELSRVLTHYESAHKWSPGDESLDAATLTEQLPGSEFRKQ
ncbi:MAG: hypothetical protein ACRD3C_18155 [Vicinamibacterales bacterium]